MFKIPLKLFLKKAISSVFAISLITFMIAVLSTSAFIENEKVSRAEFIKNIPANYYGFHLSTNFEYEDLNFELLDENCVLEHLYMPLRYQTTTVHPTGKNLMKIYKKYLEKGDMPQETTGNAIETLVVNNSKLIGKEINVTFDNSNFVLKVVGSLSEKVYTINYTDSITSNSDCYKVFNQFDDGKSTIVVCDNEKLNDVAKMSQNSILISTKAGLENSREFLESTGYIVNFNIEITDIYNEKFINVLKVFGIGAGVTGIIYMCALTYLNLRKNKYLLKEKYSKKAHANTSLYNSFIYTAFDIALFAIISICLTIFISKVLFPLKGATIVSSDVLIDFIIPLIIVILTDFALSFLYFRGMLFKKKNSEKTKTQNNSIDATKQVEPENTETENIVQKTIINEVNTTETEDLKSTEETTTEITLDQANETVNKENIDEEKIIAEDNDTEPENNNNTNPEINNNNNE